MRRLPKSDFCDLKSQGAYSPCDFINSALQKGLESLVFELPNNEAEKQRLISLREEYKGRLEILFAEVGEKSRRDADPLCDLLIGEVQTLNLGRVVVPVPKNADELYEAAKHVGLRFYHMAQLYHEATASLPKRTGCDMVRLKDLNAIWNCDRQMFDENNFLYLNPLTMCIDRLILSDTVLEVRTMPRKKGNPAIRYPDLYALRRVAGQRMRVMLSSGSDHPDQLCASFREALLQLRACGIGSVYYPKERDWAQLSF